jgi:hypothetical protein
LKNIPCHGVKQATPCQFWPQGDSSSGRAHAPFLWAETKPQINLGMPNATHWRSPVWLWHLMTASLPPHLMSPFPQTVNGERRLRFAESLSMGAT